MEHAEQQEILALAAAAEKLASAYASVSSHSRDCAGSTIRLLCQRIDSILLKEEAASECSVVPTEEDFARLMGRKP